MTEKAPTYEEVVAFAKSEGLLGKVDTAKFYDWYAKQNFMYRGYLMDWKGKLHEWAARQKGTVRQTTTEYKAVQKTGGRQILLYGKYVSDKDYLVWLKQEVAGWKKGATT